MITDPIGIALRVAQALESCGVRYLVGGSLASSVSGEPRSTLDVDLVVALTEADIEPLLAALGDEFSLNFEQIKTHYDKTGRALSKAKGNVETTWKIEKGE